LPTKVREIDPDAGAFVGALVDIDVASNEKAAEVVEDRIAVVIAKKEICIYPLGLLQMTLESEIHPTA